MTQEKGNHIPGDWKREMRDLLQRLVGVTTVRSAPASSLGKGTTNSTGAKLYDLEGQEFSDIKVGELIEIIPTVDNPSLHPYLPVACNRQELYKLNKPKTGLVVKKSLKDTRLVFQEINNSQSSNTSTTTTTTAPVKPIIHGQAELLEVLLGDEEILVEIWSPSCDPKKSFLVRKLTPTE